MKKSIVLLLIVMSVLLFSSCTKTENKTVNKDVNKITTKVEEKDLSNIKIPVLAPVSGAAASYGEDAVNAYNIIVDGVNAEGGIDGRQVELIVEDSKCSGKDAVGAIQKLINVDKAQVILGAICSAATMPTGKIANAKQIPIISPTSSAPDVGKIGPFVKRYWNDNNATAKVAEFIKSKGYKNAAILVENTDYGVGYSEAFKKNFDGNVALEVKYNPDEKDFSIIAKNIMKNIDDIDFLIFVPNTDSSAIGNLKALEKEGVLEKLKGRIFGSEALILEGVIDAVGYDALEGIHSTTMSDIENLDEKAANFIEKFEEKYEIKSNSLFVMLEAEAMSVILDAIREVGYDSEQIQNYLVAINEKNKRNGLFGEYYFDKSEVIGLEFLVKQYVDGKIVVVK